MRKKVRIGISACLMGFRYRYDGTSKMDPGIIGTLQDRVEFVPFCPEDDAINILPPNP